MPQRCALCSKRADNTSFLTTCPGGGCVYHRNCLKKWSTKRKHCILCKHAPLAIACCYTLSSIVIEVIPEVDEEERKGSSLPMQGTDVPVIPVVMLNETKFEFQGPRVEPVMFSSLNNAGENPEASYLFTPSAPAFEGVDQEIKFGGVSDPLLGGPRNVPVDNVGSVADGIWEFFSRFGGYSDEAKVSRESQVELTDIVVYGGSVDGGVRSDAPIPEPRPADPGLPVGGWPMFGGGSGFPLRPAMASSPLLSLPSDVSSSPMFVATEATLEDRVAELIEDSMPIVRCPEAKSDGFGGPGDDGYMLNNFGSRNLMISDSDFRMYDLPESYRIGDEKFQRLYAHYTPMFLGLYWDLGNRKVRLPACIVEAGVAYAIRLKHDREGFALVEVHVREKLFNVRDRSEQYRFICQFAPYVIWNAVDCDENHSLQRFVDGEYWNCKRVRQTFGRMICLVLLLLAVIGGGLFYGSKFF